MQVCQVPLHSVDALLALVRVTVGPAPLKATVGLLVVVSVSSTSTDQQAANFYQYSHALALT